MRKFLLALLLLLFSLWLCAQEITFTDWHLSTALLTHQPAIDTDKNGSISLQEAALVDTLNLPGKQIASVLELTYFTHLRYLNISDNSLDTISLIHWPFLTYLNADFNQLTSIDCSQNPQLHYLSVRENHLAHLHLDANPLLDTLRADHSHVHHMKLYNCSLLKYLSCGHNELDSLNLSANKHITYLDLHGSFFKQIVGIEGLTGLQYLDLEDGKLTQLDVSNCSSLNFLYVQTNPELLEVCISPDQYNELGCTQDHCFYKDASTSWSTSCGVVAGINGESPNSNFAYPNPASKHINVPEQVMDCFSITGQHYQFENSGRLLNLTDLPKGVYFFRYASGKGERIVVQ